MKLIQTSLILALFFFNSVLAHAVGDTKYVSDNKSENSFVIAEDEEAAQMLIDSKDDPGVIRAFNDLQDDIFKVTDIKPVMNTGKVSGAKNVIIAGTLGQSKLIDKLVSKNIIDGDELKGKWEKFIIKTVKNPMPGIDNALIIAGSDKRGTIFGMFDLSQQMGVSPWYWWADVPVKKKEISFLPKPDGMFLRVPK